MDAEFSRLIAFIISRIDSGETVSFYLYELLLEFEINENSKGVVFECLSKIKHSDVILDEYRRYMVMKAMILDRMSLGPNSVEGALRSRNKIIGTKTWCSGFEDLILPLIERPDFAPLQKNKSFFDFKKLLFPRGGQSENSVRLVFSNINRELTRFLVKDVDNDERYS